MTIIFRVIFSAIVLTLLWESVRFIGISVFDIADFYFPDTLVLVSSIIKLLRTEDLILCVIITFFRILLCIVAVSLIGLIVGIGLGIKSRLYVLLRPVWDFLRSIPPSTLFPIFLILFGIGLATKLVLAIYFASLMLSLSIADAVRSVFDKEINVWKQMGISARSQIWYFLLPQIIYALFSSMRIVASIVVALLIITEMYLGQLSGVGGKIKWTYDNYQFPTMYALIIITGIMGYTTNLIIDTIAKKFEYR